MKQILLTLVFALASPASANSIELPLVEWEADKAHSSIEFRTTHWGIHDIIGWFTDFDITVISDPAKFEEGTIEARVGLSSVVMPNPDMAGNLKGAFDIEKYPDTTFRSTEIKKLEENQFEIVGNLTIKGVTRRIRFVATLNGFALKPDGAPGFTARTTIQRLDFGIGGDELLRDDNMIGHAVHITCNIRLGYAE